MNILRYSSRPDALVHSLSDRFSLVRQMVRREVLSRYRGSVMGLFWAFLQPLLMLAVYAFVFGVVFKARFAGRADSQSEFAILLFAGLIMHSLFSECITRSPTLILSNVNYVKRVVFPLEILSWVAVFTAGFHALISALVLVAFALVLGAGVPWTVFLFPVVLLPLLLLCMGTSWFLASFGVYVRDVNQIVAVISTALLFLSPIFYPVTALPDFIQPYVYLNPLTVMIEASRDVLVRGNWPDWHALGLYTVISALVAWLGFFWFQNTRRGFADVL
ncbi:MAG: ABC transporter permease [Gammaproteobacteria bacterium]|nr:ABC transporter permease [Gammaproteobacteria bacterium]